MIVTCPTCKTAIEWSTQKWRPFCSERCQLIDLGRWADEAHRIAGTELPVNEREATNPDER